MTLSLRCTPHTARIRPQAREFIQALLEIRRGVEASIHAEAMAEVVLLLLLLLLNQALADGLREKVKPGACFASFASSKFPRTLS